jgi:hypothetical protein
MALYEISPHKILSISPTSFSEVGLRERQDLQRLFRDQIDILLPEAMVIAEEFGDWEDARRRIDLLALDKKANLVVVELKRTEDGGHMELQAIRYAAMVSTMTFDQVVHAHTVLLSQEGKEESARETILNFLEWEEPEEEKFAKNIRIVLVSAEFSREITTTVLWLNKSGLDIQCIRIKPYSDNGRVLINVEQIIPIPEAADYQVRVREKEERGRIVQKTQWDEAKFLKILEENAGPKAAGIARHLMDWAQTLVDQVGFGEGQIGTFTSYVKVQDKNYHPFVLKTDGMVVVRLVSLKGKGPFKTQENLMTLLERFNRISGINWSPDTLDGYPRFPLLLLEDEANLGQFKETILWFIKMAKREEQ